MSTIGRPKKVRKPTGRYWHGLPVYEAIADLKVTLIPADLKKAKPMDFTCCVFANACYRLFLSRDAVFVRTIAYIETALPDGTRIVERYMINPTMQAQIKAFDLSHDIPMGGFILIAPTQSETLNAQREQSRRSRSYTKQRKARREAIVRGENVDDIPYVAEPIKQKKPDLQPEWRNGTGLVKFPIAPRPAA